MAKIARESQREIIQDFSREIISRRYLGPKPTKAVIAFRNDLQTGKERDIWFVPIDLLRYRKDNGRIASDVLSYEKNYGVLSDGKQETQNILRKFLEAKDKEKTGELELSIQHETQREPAIITCDGFLINGNRRKMVYEHLLEKTKDREKYGAMKVVILPGEGEEGGPPTKVEIEIIENRYQLQSDGKAEYYSFDKALSMKRKIDLGMDLEQQLRDDPQYSGLPDKKFKEAVRKTYAEYLLPLECVDEYLSHLGREGLYDTVSTGISDREGRWQAFLDYADFVHQRLKDEKRRIQDGIQDHEVGKIKDAAFKIIRKREIPQLGIKVHQVMRDFPKLLKNKESKKELLTLAEFDMELSPEEKKDNSGKDYDQRKIDHLWGEKFKEPIIRITKTAYQILNHGQERETPLKLLVAALDKLNHSEMDVRAISLSDLPRAMALARKIQQQANIIERSIYQIEKSKGDLKAKFNC